MQDYKTDLYFGRDVKVNDWLIIHQPTVKDIFDYTPKTDDLQNTIGIGEIAYFSMVSTICAIPADFDLQLDNAGIRYEDVNPLDFFFTLVKMYKLTPDATSIIFGDIDFTQFELYENPETKQQIYVDSVGHKLDKPLYQYMIGIIRDMHNLTAQNTKWENEASRQMHLEYERKRSQRHHHKKVQKSVLIPYIAMMVNNAAFKYDREQTLQLNIYFFYDCLKQILHSQQVDHLMTGVYVGLIDTKKMNLEESLNMMRSDI